MDNLHKLSLAVLDTLNDYLMTSSQFDLLALGHAKILVEGVAATNFVDSEDEDDDGTNGVDDADDVVEEEVPPDDDA